ncbi:uncharacterized protein [Apostichopus japonicus]|uniref:uncharacterized protein isoform X8 n=1 Tax=Stichopus japonicus TaxID=307972 RepID=UPI003AB5AA62
MSFIVFTHFVLRIWLSSVVLGLTKGQCSTGECEASYFDPDLVITPNQDCFANHSTVTLSCSVKLGGPPFNTCQNGTWELPSASCDGFTCDPPSVGDSVILTPNKTTYLARETVSFSCGGLNLTGPSDASCGPGGIWEPSTIPVCETFCNVLPEIVNGNVNSTDQIDLGDELDIVCRANYSVPAGEDPFIRCNGEQWSSIPTCYPQCKPLEEPEYGIVSPGLAQGITVNYSCEWGFELNGTRSVECQNATWSVHTTPTCDAKPCFPSFEQQNHLVYEPVNYVYRNGSTVNFSCEGDSRLEGEPFAICLYGNWSNSPDCLESCNVTGVPNSNLTESTLLPDSKSTTVECDNGFTFFEGRSGFDLKCSNGTLSREIPIKCFADCQTVANIPNGHITSSVYHGVTVNISCDPGYLLKGPSTALCDDGNWTPEIVSSCDELSSSTVGSTTVSTVSDGTTPLTNETTPSRGTTDVTTSMETTSDVTTGLSSSTVGSTTVSTVSDGTPPLTDETTPSRADVTTSMETTSDVTTGLSSSTVGSTTVSTVSDGTPPLTDETTPSRGTTDVTTSMETTSDVTTGLSSSTVGSTTVSTVSDGTPPLTDETTPSRGTTDVTTSMETTSDVTTGLSSSTVGSTTVSTVSDGTPPLTDETTPSRGTTDVTTSMKTTSDVTTGLSSSTVGSTTVSTVSDGTPPLTNETTPSRGTTDVTTSMKTTSDVTTGLSSSTVGSTTVSTVSDGTPPLTNETTPSRGTSETDVTTSMETTSDVTTGPSSSPVGSTTVSTVSDGTPPLTNETTPSRAIPCPPPVLTDLNSRIDIELDEYPHETIVTFSCLGDFILKGILTSTCVHGIWVSQNYPTCVAFDSVEEELIEIIETTFTTNTTTEEVRDAAETIQFATSDDSFTRNDPTRLQLIIQSLENVVDTNDVSMNVTTPVINIANNLMEFDESSLLNISGRVVDALEQQISSFQSSGESGNYSLVLNNIGIKTAKLNLNAFGDSFGFGYIFPDEQSPSLDGDLIRDNTRLFASGDKVPDRNTASSISIPKSVLESTGLPALELPVSFAVYTSSKLFMSSNMSKEDRIASQIISAKVEGAPKIEKLPRTSTITAKFLTNVILTKREVITSRKCVFWSYDNDNNEGTWSVEGCTTNIGEFDLTVCSCDHLTSFAILATVEREINWVILIGSIFSTILLILTVCTLASCFRTSRFKQSTFIYINICICLLGLLISYILSFEAVLHDIACGVASAAVHYFCLATVTWLSVDSIHMYLLFVRPAYTAIRQFSSVSCFIAYGLPLLPVILVAVYARIFNTTDPEFCFISDGPTLISGLLIIDVVLLLLSCAMFFFIIRKGLRVSLSVTSQKELMRRMQTYARVRNGILLWLMTILSSAFGYSVYIYPDSYALEYLYAISISVQSLAIFIMFCFANYQNSKQVLKVNATGSQGDVRDGDDDTFGSERAESMDDHIPMNQLGSGMIPRPKICN